MPEKIPIFYCNQGIHQLRRDIVISYKYPVFLVCRIQFAYQLRFNPEDWNAVTTIFIPDRINPVSREHHFYPAGNFRAIPEFEKPTDVNQCIPGFTVFSRINWLIDPLVTDCLQLTFKLSLAQFQITVEFQ